MTKWLVAKTVNVEGGKKEYAIPEHPLLHACCNEDVKEQSPDSIEVFSYNKQGQSITQDLLSMCTRCRLLFRREDGDNGLFGIVKIRRMDEPEIRKLEKVE